MNNLNITDKLKDIKASSIIQIDFLPYIYIAIASIIFIIILIFIFIYFKNKRRKKISKIELAKKNLKNIDFNQDTKSIVYSFSVNGYECLDEKNKSEFEQIVKRLEPYKYKKVVTTKISGDLIDDMKDYIKVRV